MNPILIVIILCLLLYILYTFVTGKPENSPPGVWRLPIWGSYWLLLWGSYNFPHKTISYYMKKYKSKIISCYLGNAFTVIVNDYAGVKEVLSRREFDGRLSTNDAVLMRGYGQKLGIFFNDDIEWQEQRRFALRNLRDFGFGRRFNSLENNFAEELNILINTIRDGPINDMEKRVVNDGRALFPDVLFPSSANTIWSIMTGERFDRSEHELLHEWCHGAHRFQKGGDTTGGAVSMTFWLRHFGNLFGWKDFIEGNQTIIDFVKRYIDRLNNEKLGNSDGFIPAYLREIEKLNGQDETYSEKQLIMIVADFVFPSISAVPSVITHAIKYMMHYPDVMKRIQEEIDRVVGRERLPGWDDRKEMLYTEAALREVMRIEPLTPWALPHRSTQDTTLQEYNIPMDTVIITNLAAMHSDPDLWGDPETFRPERFLTDDGSRLAKDLSLPFGFGRRVCAGETFARFMLFGLFASLLQQFDFKLIEGEPLSLEDKIPGVIVQPKKAWIEVVPRA